jgi:hypothetical protein
VKPQCAESAAILQIHETLWERSNVLRAER